MDENRTGSTGNTVDIEMVTLVMGMKKWLQSAYASNQGACTAAAAISDDMRESLMKPEERTGCPKGFYLLVGERTDLFAYECAKFLKMRWLTINMEEITLDCILGTSAERPGAAEGILPAFVEREKDSPCIVILKDFHKADLKTMLAFHSILCSAEAENVMVKSAREMSAEMRKRRGISDELLESHSDFTDYSNVYFFVCTDAGCGHFLEKGDVPEEKLKKELLASVASDTDPVTNKTTFPSLIMYGFRRSIVGWLGVSDAGKVRGRMEGAGKAVASPRAKAAKPASEKKSIKQMADNVARFEQLRSTLKNEVIGQSAVVDDVVDDILSSFNHPEERKGKPRGIYLFAGTPGVGKTYLAKRVAKHLGMKCLSLNMAEYNSHEDGKLTLMGTEASYGTCKEGTLFTFVEEQKGKPCIIIMDEIEKAHIDVIHQLLQILDSAQADNILVKTGKKLSEKVQESKGIKELCKTRPENTSFENVYFFFTTNAGRPLYEDGKQPSADITKSAIIDGISTDINPATREPYFPEAILSRFQTGVVSIFRHLTPYELIRIGQMGLEQGMTDIMDEYDVNITMAPETATLLLLREGGQMDARNLSTMSRKYMGTLLSQTLATIQDYSDECTNVVTMIDPEDRRTFQNIISSGAKTQKIVMVGENQKQTSWLMESAALQQKSKPAGMALTFCFCEDYEKAYKEISGEVFGIPIVYVLFPEVEDTGNKTISSNRDAMLARDRKRFRDFLIQIREFSDKAMIQVITKETVTKETENSLSLLGVNGIIDISRGEELLYSHMQDAARMAQYNASCYDLARRGKAVRFNTVPAVYEDTIYIRYREFDLIDNIMPGDREFLTAKDHIPNVSFDDIIGGEQIKEEAADFIAFLKNPGEYLHNGLKVPKGLLFYGPPGTGKTHLAKAIAHEADVPFISLNGGVLAGGGVELPGQVKLQGPELLRKYFSIARKYAPSILFIDEIDCIGLQRAGSSAADNMVNTLLTEMDGFESHDSNPVIVMAATNAGIDQDSAVHGRFLDEALVRRFSRKFNVSLPAADHILAHLTKETGITEGLESAAMIAYGLSYGIINNAVEIAKRQAVREKRAMDGKMLEEAIETVRYGEKRERTPERARRTAYHEAGHACIACIAGAYPAFATIVSRGDFGGKVNYFEDSKSVVYSREWFERRIISALAGRCGEVICYGQEGGITAGPSQDIRSAYGLITEMVYKLGMDPEVGMTYVNVSGNGMLPEPMQKRVDQLFTQYYERCMQMLQEHRKLFEALAEKLLEKQTLSRNEMIAITEENI